MKKASQFLLFFLFALLIQNCEKDDFDSQNDDGPGLNSNDLIFQSENFGNTTTGNFIGSITNENGDKLENVQITIGNSYANTDRNGIFIINNAEVFENFAYIKAYKDGYIKGSRVVIPKTDGVNRITIVLLEKNVTATVNSGEPSTVSLSSNVTIGFSGDFITSDGSPYNGQVEVILDYLRPNNTSTFEQMPGSLFAQTTSNDAVSLETYGMFSVNLFSTNGEPLNIDENNPATIEVRIDYTQTDIAPETMPLWYFDETVGYWKEQGVAIKTDNKYVGEVTHFTWWNCDLPLEYVNLCFSISSNTSEASTPYRVSTKRNSNNQQIYNGIMTSQDGLECGLIPENEDVTVSVYNVAETCNFQLIHEEIINGFSSDSNVNISFSEVFQTTMISGTATNCNGDPLTNGYLFIDKNNSFSITDGTINVGIQHCTSYTTQIQIFDFDTSQWSVSDAIILNGEPINFGTLSTCDDTGGIYNGNIHLKNQAEVDSFEFLNYSGVNGDFEIGEDNFNVSSDIADLTPLMNIESIQGNLSFYNNSLLENLDGLNNLETVNGDLAFSANSSLVSTSGLNSLNSIGGLYFFENQNLESIGLNSITNISGNVVINNNDSLTTLDGLNNVSSFLKLTIVNNELLNSITGLSNLTTLFRLDARNNSSLINFTGLEQLTQLDFLWVLSNPVLTNLDGLENVITMTPSTSVGFANISIGYLLEFDVFITGPNPNLTDFCALENLFVNGIGSSLEPVTQFTITDNGYNPTIQDLVDGNCSQ